MTPGAADPGAPPRLPRWRIAVSAAAALALAALVLHATARFGPGVSPDSVYYLSAARSLAGGEGLTTFEGRPLVDWPPLFPALLAAGDLVGLDPLDGARLVNAGLAGLTVLLAGLWLGRALCSGPLFLVAIVFVATAPALTRVALMAWSEPLFLCLTFACLAATGRHLATGRRRHLAAAAVTAAAAALTRYAGLPIYLAVGLSLLLRPGWRRGRRAGSAVLFLAAAGTPALLWVVRNQRLAGEPAGERAAAATPLASNLRGSVHQVAQWFFPSGTAATGEVPPGAYVSAFLLAALLAALVALGVRELRPGRRARPGRASVLETLPFAAFVAAYWSFSVAAASLVAMDPLNQRLMSPVLLPLACLVFVAADRLPEALGGGPARRRVAAVVVALVLAWPALAGALGGARALPRYRAEGIVGYSTRDWRRPELAAALRRLPAGAPVFSNAPDALYFLTGIEAGWTPSRARYRSGEALAGEREAFRRRLCQASPAYLVWLDTVERSYLYPEGEVLELAAGSVGAEPVIATEGARVYRLECRRR